MNVDRVVSLVTVLLLASSICFAWRDDSLQEAKTRADASRLEDQPSTCMDVARKQLKAASDFYDGGDYEKARAAIADIVSYSAKAADASDKTGKRLKDTEIALRKVAEKLREIKRTLDFDEQSTLESAIDKLEQLRTGLLSRMFAKGKKK